MILEAVLAALGFMTNGPASSGILSQILNVLAPLPLFVVLGWVGYELWSGDVGVERLPGTVRTQTA